MGDPNIEVQQCCAQSALGWETFTEAKQYQARSRSVLGWETQTLKYSNIKPGRSVGLVSHPRANQAWHCWTSQSHKLAQNNATSTSGLSQLLSNPASSPCIIFCWHKQCSVVPYGKPFFRRDDDGDVKVKKEMCSIVWKWYGCWYVWCMSNISLALGLGCYDAVLLSRQWQLDRIILHNPVAPEKGNGRMRDKTFAVGPPLPHD